MRITKDGNIGIGTPTPQAKLAVNGDVYARKVKVTATGWPDYVFQPAYPLLPLPEVEKYILQHRHLPEMPSANEVETNGLDLGNNQATLLKKIEELTLHAIAQHKKIETKQQELVELKSVVQDLLERIEKLEKNNKK